jgi:hypothetical protein
MDKSGRQINPSREPRQSDEKGDSNVRATGIGILILIGTLFLVVWKYLTGKSKTEKQPVSPESIRRGHEQSDMNVRAVVISGIGLFITIIVIGFVLRGAFGYFSSHRIKPSMPPSALTSIERLPPEPRLQVNPQEDLKKMREAEDRVLNSYGWVDEKAGIVRIPIDRAMELIVKRGLPVRSAKNDEK